MDPEIEDCYIELLREWKKDDDNIKDQLNEIMKKLDALANNGKIWSVRRMKIVGFLSPVIPKYDLYFRI